MTHSLSMRRPVGIAVVTIAVGVLVGWWAQIPALVSVLVDRVAMQPTTAVLLGLLGLGASVRSEDARLLLALLTLAIAFSSAAQWVTGRHGVDTLFGPVDWYVVEASHPGRPSPTTLVAAAALALGLVSSWARQWLLPAAGAVSLVALLGHATGSRMAQWGGTTPMAVHTSACVLALSLALWPAARWSWQVVLSWSLTLGGAVMGPLWWMMPPLAWAVAMGFVVIGAGSTAGWVWARGELCVQRQRTARVERRMDATERAARRVQSETSKLFREALDEVAISRENLEQIQRGLTR